MPLRALQSRKSQTHSHITHLWYSGPESIITKCCQMGPQDDQQCLGYKVFTFETIPSLFCSEPAASNCNPVTIAFVVNKDSTFEYTYIFYHAENKFCGFACMEVLWKSNPSGQSRVGGPVSSDIIQTPLGQLLLHRWHTCSWENKAALKERAAKMEVEKRKSWMKW